MSELKTEHEWVGGVHLTRTFLCDIHEESRWNWLVYFCTSSTWPEPWFEKKGSGDYPSQQSNETYLLPDGVMLARCAPLGLVAPDEWIRIARVKGLI
jgi:hypothetical protein